jgi:hypothetical protein
LSCFRSPVSVGCNGDFSFRAMMAPDAPGRLWLEARQWGETPEPSGVERAFTGATACRRLRKARPQRGKPRRASAGEPMTNGQ